MTPFQFLVLALTTWRLSALLSYENGPFRVFRKLRKVAGIEYYDNGDQVEKEYTGFASLFACVWCLSFWIGVFIAVMFRQLPTITIYFSLPFALSAGAIVVERITNG